MRYRAIYTIFCVYFCLFASYPTFADEPLAELRAWRNSVSQTRILAENDPQQAYTTAIQLLSNKPEDALASDHIHVLNVLARAEIYLGKISASERHANQALALAEQHQDKVGQIEAYLNITLITVNQAKIRQTTEAAEKSLALLQDVDRPDLLAEAMLRMMSADYRRGWLDEAVTLGLQNLEIAKQSEELLPLLYANQGLAIIHLYNSHHKEAYQFFGKMQYYAELIPSKLWIGHAVLGKAYAGAVLVKQGQKTVEEVEALYLQATEIFDEAGFPFSLVGSLTGLGHFLYEHQHYHRAEKILTRALEEVKKNNTPIPEWFVLNAYSDVLEKLDRHDEALRYSELAYQLAKQIEYPMHSEISAANLAQKIAKRGDDYQLAYQYMLESHTLNQRVKQESSNKHVIDITEKYKQESKQKKIDQLQLEAERREAELQQQSLRQRLLWTILFASGVIILFSIGFIWRLRRSNRLLALLNERVQRSQAQLQAVVNALPDALFVLDQAGRFLEVHSPVFEQKLGMQPGDLKGHHLATILSKQAARRFTHSLMELTDVSSAVTQEVEVTLMDDVHWLELSAVKANWVSDEGEQFIALARDITERKQIETIKLQNEQQFRTLVENSPDAIVRYDKQGKRRYVNSAFAAQLGASAEELVGDTAGSLLDPTTDSSDVEEYKSKLTKAVETGIEQRVLVTLTFSDQAVHHADIRFCPEFDVNGRVESVLALWRDVTQLKQAENEIEQAYNSLRELAERREEALEEERKRIARDMHDELGQYLTSLKMRVSILRMQPDLDKEAVSQQLNKMLAVLDETIGVVRKLAAQIRPVQLEVGINAAVEGLVDEFIKQTELTCEFESSCPDGDMEESTAIVVFRLLQESLTNIRRYANADKVEIKLDEDSDNYHLTIKDNGVGFDVKNVRQGSFGLLGMQERVNNLGGTLTFDSVLKQGTTITVLIPRQKQDSKND